MSKTALTLTALLVLLLATPAFAAERPVHNMRYAIDSEPSFEDLERTGRRHGVVVLQAWRLDQMRAIKAANPNVKVLVYKNLSFAISGRGPGGLSSTGVNVDEAKDEWYLKNTWGERFTSNGYGYLWAMDVGSSGYQQRWADNVVAEVERNGWDGVFLDDANPTMKYHYDVSRVAKYPSDRAYTAATTEALAHIGPRIRSAGKLAIANNAQWVEYFDVGVDWLQHLSGQMDEMFLKWSQTRGEGYRDEYQWEVQLNEIKAAEQRGKMFIGITQSSNDDHKAALFGYATTLLAGNGRTHFAMHGDYTNETWFPEYNLSIGSPTDGEREDSSGVHRRPFTNGMVLVNPTSSTQTASLPNVYTAPGLGEVTRVTLAPQTGRVLQKVPESTTPTPAPTPEPTPTKRPRKGALLATVNQTGKVALTWPRAGELRSIGFKVFRGSTQVRSTYRLGFVDESPPPGVHTYRVLAVNSEGETIRTSRVRVLVPDGPVSVRSDSPYGRVKGYLSAPDPSRWDQIYVQRRVRSSSTEWARASVVKRPDSLTSFRLTLPASVETRMLVRSRRPAVRPLRSPGVRLATR